MKAVLGEGYVPGDEIACTQGAAPGKSHLRITEELTRSVVSTATHLGKGVVGSPGELAVYQGAALYALWDEHGPLLQGLIDRDEVDVPFYDQFVERCRFFFGHPGIVVPQPAHLLALLYQMRRAWYFAWSKIRGGSPSAAAARAAIWRANLGGDLCAYTAGLYRRMDEIPVLITGETGTGKELAAQCVGWSRYIPFDPKTGRFVMKYAAELHVRNLCEVPRDLVESALFGHTRGSFTGAAADATGCFALPKPYGSLFLDEIGELPEHVQVKLLRPLQSREYVPIGESRPRKIAGRHIFATHRDLEALCREGKFRPDLHERMNGVPIHMPSLRQMVAEAPDEMRHYVRWFVAEKIDDPQRVEAWTDRVVSAIDATRARYSWPRNLRELRNYTERYLLTGGQPPAPAPSPAIVVRGTLPSPPAAEGDQASTCLPSSGLLGRRAKEGAISVEELTRAYVTRVHALTNQNRTETARRTGLNWRTVGALIDPVRLARWLEDADKKTEPK